jgi:hypothetical protein
MSYPTRNTSIYDLPELDPVFLTQEDTDLLLCEDSAQILVQRPERSYSVTLSSRNTSSYSLPTRH